MSGINIEKACIPVRHHEFAFNRMAFQRYVESDSWKCAKSPTGAHHWLIEDSTMKCKFCGKKRKGDFTQGEINKTQGEINKVMRQIRI